MPHESPSAPPRLRERPSTYHFYSFTWSRWMSRLWKTVGWSTAGNLRTDVLAGRYPRALIDFAPSETPAPQHFQRSFIQRPFQGMHLNHTSTVLSLPPSTANIVIKPVSHHNPRCTTGYVSRTLQGFSLSTHAEIALMRCPLCLSTGSASINDVSLRPAHSWLLTVPIMTFAARLVVTSQGNIAS